MALHTLKIVVVDGGRASNYSASGGGSGSSTGKSKIDKDSPLYKLLHARDIIKKKLETNLSTGTVYAAETFTNLAVQTAKSAFSYYISDIGRSTGDSNYQARVNRAFEIGGQVLGVLRSTISSATAGFMTTGNPIGAALGAFVGLTSSVVSLGFQNAEKERAYRHTMAEERVGIDYNIGRMTGGTGVRLR